MQRIGLYVELDPGTDARQQVLELIRQAPGVTRVELVGADPTLSSHADLDVTDWRQHLSHYHGTAVHSDVNAQVEHLYLGPHVHSRATD